MCHEDNEYQYYIIDSENDWVCYGDCQACANPCPDYIPLSSKKEVLTCAITET